MKELAACLGIVLVAYSITSYATTPLNLDLSANGLSIVGILAFVGTMILLSRSRYRA